MFEINKFSYYGQKFCSVTCDHTEILLFLINKFCNFRQTIMYGKAVTAEATHLWKLFTGVTSTIVNSLALKSLLLIQFRM